MKEDMKWDLISPELAGKLFKALRGVPTQDRIVICTIGNDNITANGIILTRTPSDDTIPKKGVVIHPGEDISEDYQKTRSGNLNPGDVVYYGLYAGKQLDVTFDFETYPELKEVVDKYDFTILSLSELLFIEPIK